jgi:hypothetical protein
VRGKRATIRTSALALATAATAALMAAAPAAQASQPAAANAKPGVTGTPILLQNNAEFSGYDAGTDSSGTSYIGWIGDPSSGGGRKVHLCTLPPGAKKCQGGVQTIDGIDDSTAGGLKVLVDPSGEVSLVWFHDTTASEMGPEGAELAVATAPSGGTLSPGVDSGSAPSFGSLLDARLGPGNQIWTVATTSSDTGLQIHTDLNDPSNPVTVLKTPFAVSNAQLRFHGNNAVIVIQKAGAITVNVDYASYTNGGWTAFKRLPHTWTSDANASLVGTSAGIRLITSVDNASYYPVVWNWTGSTFADPALTGDRNNCSPSSHDLVSDNSGRIADVSEECQDLAITNLPDTRHAIVTRYSIGSKGTFAGGIPQITTTPRGTGWVAWSVESSTGNKLMVAPVLLPGLDVSVSKVGSGNYITLTGPKSCMPPVDVAVGVKAGPAKHWHVVSKLLRLGSTVLHSNTLNGAALKAGKSYTLTGTAKFANGSRHATVTASLTFTSCPN